MVNNFPPCFPLIGEEKIKLNFLRKIKVQKGYNSVGDEQVGIWID